MARPAPKGRKPGKAAKPKATPTAKRRVGRPSKLTPDEATIAAIEAISSVGGTQHEAAAHFEVSARTFEEFLRNHKEARDAWDYGAGKMRLSIRRMQIKAAQAGNATMLVWLGKQYLEQRDKQELEHTGKDGEKLAPTVIQLVPVSATNDHRASPSA